MRLSTGLAVLLTGGLVRVSAESTNNQYPSTITWPYTDLPKSGTALIIDPFPNNPHFTFSQTDHPTCNASTAEPQIKSNAHSFMSSIAFAFASIALSIQYMSSERDKLNKSIAESLKPRIATPISPFKSVDPRAELFAPALALLTKYVSDQEIPLGRDSVEPTDLNKDAPVTTPQKTNTPPVDLELTEWVDVTRSNSASPGLHAVCKHI